ncbi:hypothetical protein N7490_009165 [Penicillium lividum]|nr:hypothetical protein N7490_009165 [Penicillium lividum]
MIVDLTTFTFEWSITSPDSLYYPGRHAGTIIVSAQYPFQDRGMVVRPTWITPRLCPFVSSSGSLCPASGNWGDIWTPAMKLDELTSTLASVIHYGPLLERMPPSIQHKYIALHPFDERAWIYMTKEAWFQNATNFFCRAYNMDTSALEDGSDSDEMSSEVSSEDTEFTNSEATDDMCRSSIDAIGELLLYTRGSRDVPPELNPGGLRAHMSLEECFSSQRVRTRKDWMIEERIWANALAQDYRVKTLGYSSRY